MEQDLTSSGVEVLGEITHTMERSDLDQFESKLNDDGRRVYRVRYDREVWLGQREGTIKFRVVRGRKELGSATIAFPDD